MELAIKTGTPVVLQQTGEASTLRRPTPSRLKTWPRWVARWLPDGRREGREWVALNPRRNDRSPGSFRINLQTGKWADFATDDARGGDPVSLAAYLFGASQGEAARSLAAMLGVGK